MTRDASTFPELEGFRTVAQVADLYEISKESVYYMIYEQGRFEGVRRIGAGVSIQLIIPEAEVNRVRGELVERKAPKSYHELLNEWHLRVKTWGRENGFQPGSTGSPSKRLCNSYMEANPRDRRPVPGVRGPAFKPPVAGNDSRE